MGVVRSEVPDSREIVKAVDEALWRASAPICHIHRDGEQPPFAVVVSADLWKTLMLLIPESAEITGLVMNHGHIGGDEDDA